MTLRDRSYAAAHDERRARSQLRPHGDVTVSPRSPGAVSAARGVTGRRLPMAVNVTALEDKVLQDTLNAAASLRVAVSVLERIAVLGGDAGDLAVQGLRDIKTRLFSEASA
jgi:hypothetical protein